MFHGICVSEFEAHPTSNRCVTSVIDYSSADSQTADALLS